MKPLRIKSASGIHLPMKSEYPYRPLKHMETLRIHSASASTKHGILSSQTGEITLKLLRLWSGLVQRLPTLVMDQFQNKSGFAKTTTSLWRLFVT